MAAYVKVGINLWQSNVIFNREKKNLTYFLKHRLSMIKFMHIKVFSLQMAYKGVIKFTARNTNHK